MSKNKFLRITVSSVLILLAAWVATPKVYIHDLLHHNHNAIEISNETQLQSPATDDCDFNEYNKPVYFNIFKFIGNLKPIKPQNAVQKFRQAISLSSVFQSVLFLRGPPVTE